ncbi:MAG: autotransporter assembly complex family protein [Sphingobium sp.]
MAQTNVGTDQAIVSSPVTDPQADDTFSLDLDDRMDMGIAWPDLDASSAPQIEDLPPAPDDVLTEEVRADEAQADSGDSDDADGAQAAGEPEEEAGQVADDGSTYRYRVSITGLEGIEDQVFKGRFDSLSALRLERGKRANLAQINRRMRLDAELLDRLLRAAGYYDAQIRPAVRPPENGGDERLRVVFTVRPGTRYTLASVLLPGLSFAAARVPMLRTAFPVEVGQPVDADRIFAARNELAIALGESGFPFAKVEEPVVTVDHETVTGDLEMAVRSGGYRLFGDVTLDEASRDLLSARHLERIARFDKGDVYKATDVEDLRRAIVATGLVSSVTVTPQEQGDGEHVDVAVALTRAKLRTIAGEIGFGTGEGYRLEASWQHRNFFPPEGAVTARGLLGTREQAAGVSYRRNNFLRRDHILSAALSARHQKYDAYTANTITLAANIERQTNIIYQKKWVWSLGVEFVASRERDLFLGTKATRSRDYLIAALPGSVTYDASNDLLDPTSGFRLGARLSPEIARDGSGAYSYARAQVDGSIYLPVTDKVVVASRVRLGSILGGITDDRIAPSRRFYAGGGASVRGYGYQAIGPRDANNDPVGGKSLAEFSLEARVRLGAFGVVPFIDAGNISTGFLPNIDNFRYGAGIGLRYHSTFGPIRIDVGTPINPQKGDSRIAVYVSLGQAF